MPSLTQDEARARAALLDVASYEIDLGLSHEPTYTARTTIRFACRTPGASSFAELDGAVRASATLNGRALGEDALADGRIRLDALEAENVLEVEAVMRTGTDGDAMHRYVDPADDEVYLSAFLGSDVAHRVFACFDQPDLKASFALSVTAPPEWTVLGNGALTGEDGARRTFAPTPPLSTYLFVVCAGPWHSVRWEHAGLPFAWHARRSLAAALDRDAFELRRITEAYFDHYADYFDEPYAFDSYDQVMAPGLNWGALETAGCVTFRDEYLPPSPPSGSERRHRAMVVAHEMAHMWFGDLATPVWWEDIWLNESFADFMGFEVAGRYAGLGETLPEFTLGQAWMGYAADRRRSTHPVAPPAGSVRDADAGFEATDQITYSKGNAVVRQLVTWLGEDDFRRGVNRYLTTHRFANAALGDFLDALDAETERDVRGWADRWLRTTGFDTLRIRRDGDVPVLVREGSRPHRIEVATYDTDKATTITLDLDEAEVRLDDAAGRAVLPDALGRTYARLALDAESWRSFFADPSRLPVQQRAVLWASALETVVEGELDPRELFRLAEAHLPQEPDTTIWESTTRRLGRLLIRYLPADDVPWARERLAVTARATSADDLALPAARVVAAESQDVDELEQRLAESQDPLLRWRILARLAELGAVDTDRIDLEASQDHSTAAVVGAARVRAGRPTPEAKAEAWSVFAANDVDNRVFQAVAEGLFVPEQAGLTSVYVEEYLAEGPAWARRRGQGFSREVGHAFPMHAVGEDVETALRTALDGDVPSVLARMWNDRLDEIPRDRRVRQLFL